MIADVVVVALAILALVLLLVERRLGRASARRLERLKRKYNERPTPRRRVALVRARAAVMVGRVARCNHGGDKF